MRTTTLVMLALLATGCAGSGGDGSARGSGDTLTQRQRDSILSTSKIPGASGVGKAMKVADSVAARVRAGDTVQ
jgi:hypothetical protein